MKFPLIAIFTLLVFGFNVNGQMIINTSLNANQLVDRLVGPGVVYSNPTLSCQSSAKGGFTNASATTVTMDSGIVLTTGSAIDVYQPATFYSTVNNSTGSGGDFNLQAAASGTIYDLCKLEFDFIPIGDTVKFNYRFGSEEYPGYTCSNFNDIFSFFISGPGYPIPKNVALIPGTNCPVSINTVNGSNANPCGNVGSPCAPPNNALFINSASSNSVVYSGITQKLTAVAAVTPCSTYHMKFAIADVFDDILDSGVFLEANSFTSEAVTINNVTSSNTLGGSLNPFTIEGCNSALVTLSRPFPKTFPQTINLGFGGTATLGIDYTTPPTTVIIPANSTTVSFPITSLADGLTEGTENIKVYVYGALCSSTITDSVLVDILEFPTYSVSNDDSICAGQIAAMQVAVTPPNSNLSISWTSSTAGFLGGNANLNDSPVVSTTYTVSVNYPGCPPRDSTILISVEPTPTIALTPTNISCNGLTNGQIVATGNVTYGPNQITLQPNSVQQIGSPVNFAGLGVGNYTVSVTSAIGCSNTATTSITQPTSLTWLLTDSTNLACAQPTSGLIQTVAIGGTSPISYSISPNVGTNLNGNFSGLSIGNYTVIATDAKGCTLTKVFNLTQPVGPSFTATSSSSVLCFGDANGSIQTNAVGLVGVVNYFLQPTAISNQTGQFNNLVAGNYTIIASDASICTSSTTINVASPTQLVWDSINTTNVNCNGNQNGVIAVQASGGVGSISYLLTPSNVLNTTGVFNSLSPINYTVLATDSNNCQISTNAGITQPNVLQIANVVSSTPSCIPGNDASLTINAIGGTLPYTYSLNGNISSTNVFTNLGIGTYTILVTDAKGCIISQTHTIFSPILPSINSIATTQASCVPGCDATATVSVVAGSSSSFSYSSNGTLFQTSPILSSLCILPFTITVKDGNNCTATSQISISGLNSPSFNSIVSNNITCNGLNNGNIAVSAIGGIGAITFNLLPNNLANFSGNFSNLATGSYTVLASDANNCSATTFLNISEPNLLQIDSLQAINVNCFNANNGAINVFASGGINPLSYSISPIGISQASSQFSNLNGNVNYTILVSDSNNCTASLNQFISQPPPLTIVSSTASNITCNNQNNGSISVVANGGTGSLNYQLLPTGSANTTGNFNNLSAGIYTINVSDANNCATSTILTISNPSVLTQTFFSSTNITCHNLNNGIIQYSVSGGTGAINYTLQPNGTTNNTGLFQNLSANNYTIIATDVNGCTKTINAIITNPAQISINSLTANNLPCANDTNGIISCNAIGGTGILTFVLSPSGIANNNGQFTNLIAGNYNVLVSDANNCSVNSSIAITAPTQLIASLVNSQSISCNGNNDGIISVNAVGGIGNPTYSLFPGSTQNSTGLFTNLSSANYSIQVTDSNGCQAFINSINISNPPSLIFTSVTPTSILCSGDSSGSILVNAVGGTGPLQFSINPLVGGQSGSGAFIGLMAGSYTITASDINGCSLTTITQINQNNALQIASISSIEPSCFNQNNGQILISPSGGLMPYTYLLNNASANQSGQFQNVLGGSILISVIDAAGCQKDSVYFLNQPTEIKIIQLNLDPILCTNDLLGSIQLKASGGNGSLTYILKPLNQTNSSGIFNNLQNGIYTLTVKDDKGCEKDTIVELKPPTPFVSTIITTDVSCYGNGSDATAKLVVIGGTPPYQYLWNTNPPQTTALLDSISTGLYQVIATDNNGCKLKDSIFIEPGKCCQEVFLPTAFSPNGDAKNELFRMTTSASMEIIQFEIYNRWGNRVWSTKDSKASWDGNIDGKLAGMDTYFYLLRYKCIADQKNYLKKGEFILIR